MILPPKRARLALRVALLLGLSGCAPIGALMSPYSEKFSCKNDDHGQCIHPERAYADARAGVSSRSHSAVTMAGHAAPRSGRPTHGRGDPSDDYRASLYRELQGLIEAPVTPMLRPARTIRTLILPYADRQRPDRLYMPRYIYAVLDRPEWVVGASLVSPADQSAPGPILGQVKTPATDELESPATMETREAAQ